MTQTATFSPTSLRTFHPEQQRAERRAEFHSPAGFMSHHFFLDFSFSNTDDSIFISPLPTGVLTQVHFCHSEQLFVIKCPEIHSLVDLSFSGFSPFLSAVLNTQFHSDVDSLIVGPQLHLTCPQHTSSSFSSVVPGSLCYCPLQGKEMNNFNHSSCCWMQTWIIQELNNCLSNQLVFQSKICNQYTPGSLYKMYISECVNILHN